MRRILDRGRIGPIGCLVGASIPSFWLADRRAFAELGLENLDVAAFRRDYEMLLFATENSVVSRTFCMVLRALRDVEPKEARALAEMIGPAAGRLLLECHAALRGADLGADWAKTVRPVLDRARETWLEESVKAALERRNR